MDEHMFEEIVKEALADYAEENDLPIDVVTAKDKGFTKDEAGLIIKIGVNEFHLFIHQTVFE